MMNLIFCLAIQTANPQCAPVIAGADLATVRPVAMATDNPIPPTLLYAALVTNPAILNARQVPVFISPRIR